MKFYFLKPEFSRIRGYSLLKKQNKPEHLENVDKIGIFNGIPFLVRKSYVEKYSWNVLNPTPNWVCRSVCFCIDMRTFCEPIVHIYRKHSFFGLSLETSAYPKIDSRSKCEIPLKNNIIFAHSGYFPTKKNKIFLTFWKIWTTYDIFYGIALLLRSSNEGQTLER